MTNFDNLKDQAMGAVNGADEAKSDAVLNKADELASSATGGKFDGQIDQAREAADARLGDEANQG